MLNRLWAFTATAVATLEDAVGGLFVVAALAIWAVICLAVVMVAFRVVFG